MIEKFKPNKHSSLNGLIYNSADEMKIKYRRNFGNEEGIMFSTIHALCLKILLTYGNMTGDCIINSSDVFFFLSNLAKNDRSINDVNNAVNAFMTQYSAAKNNLVNIAEVDPEGIPKKSFVYMAEKYEEKKRLENKIDFDMNTKKDEFKSEKNTFNACLFSVTEAGFYIPLAIVSTGIIILTHIF